MNIKIINQEKNPTIGVDEIFFKVEHKMEPTPARSEIRAKMIAENDFDENLFVVNKLSTETGVGITEGQARIYENLKDLVETENDYIIHRNEIEV